MLSMKRSKLSNLHIPEEIIIKILLLLPFESILTCKLVSNQWRNLITNPKFFKLYHPRSSLSLFLCKDDLYCLLIRPDNKNPDTIEGPRHPHFMVHRVPIDLRAGLWSVNYHTYPKLLSGSSSVVACISRTKGDFLIYNLFNGASFIVADAPHRQHYAYGWFCYGFGYDRYDDDYKIMVVCRNIPTDDTKRRKRTDTIKVQNEDNSLFWVYSVKNHVWNQLKGFPYASYQPGWGLWQPCPFNGVLHWIATIPKIPKKMVILTFDLHTCKFGEILLPPCVSDYDEHARVAELDGKLCLWRFHKIKLWVMKEYGVGESWAELKSKPLEKLTPAIKTFMRLSSRVTPMATYECRSGRKGVLFVCNSNWSLYWYDLKNGNVKVISNTTWCRRGGSGQSRNQDFEYIKKFVG